MKVYVHLDYEQDAARWEKKFNDGQVPDRTPYGYHHAEQFGCSVRYSIGHVESPFVKWLRQRIAKVIGFDVLHALRNRMAMLNADVIWTHTEYNALGVSFVLCFTAIEKRPCVIAQFVWLTDKWDTLSGLKQAMYRVFMDTVSIVTFHSSTAVDRAKAMFPSKEARTVLFGVSTESFPIHQIRQPFRTPLRILSLGNDVARDWQTLCGAFGNRDNYDLKILTSNPIATAGTHYRNVEIKSSASLTETLAYYDWADIVVVPLKENYRVSGITVVLESVAQHIPVVCTDTGGMRTYFSDDHLWYVPPYQSSELVQAVEQIKGNFESAMMKAKAAQMRFFEFDLASAGFARRHVELSKALLANRPAPKI